MTLRRNRRAIFAKVESTKGTAETLTRADAIPVNDITNTPLVSNEVESDELTGFFGAPDRAIASKSQAITIVSTLRGGGVGTGAKAKEPQAPPQDSLFQACFHKVRNVGADLTAISTNDIRGILYSPTDGDGVGATIRYVLDRVSQEMVDARGTLSFALTTGEFSTLTFEMQSRFNAPAAGGSPTTGTKPTFQENQLVSGQGSLWVPGLPAQIPNCVRSFSFTQGSVLSEKDCATREGNNPIEYLQTNRVAVGEMEVEMDVATLEEFYKVAGTSKGVSAPIAVKTVDGKQVPNSFVTFGTNIGNQFVFGASNILLGAPTEGDRDGISTYTIPLTFKPLTAESDYEFGFVGDLN